MRHATVQVIFYTQLCATQPFRFKWWWTGATVCAAPGAWRWCKIRQDSSFFTSDFLPKSRNSRALLTDHWWSRSEVWWVNEATTPVIPALSSGQSTAWGRSSTACTRKNFADGEPVVFLADYNKRGMEAVFYRSTGRCCWFHPRRKTSKDKSTRFVHIHAHERMMMMIVNFIDNQRQKKTRNPYTKGDKETNCRQK